MSHWPALPILIPLVGACLSLLVRELAVRRGISLCACAALLATAAYSLILVSDSVVHVYRLGDWPAPYGIVLVLDRLSAMMVALTALLALPALLYAMAGTDSLGRHFHAFFQFQLAGLNGAFLTGDLFNLFVFFEVLLIASYALLAHGGGAERARAGLVYVVLNLAGSALFLVALGFLYGILGTLNLADIAVVLPGIVSTDQALVRTAGALLVTVFALKAALLPVSFWLPSTYAAATAPAAATFAIMTKVGIYALLRISAIGFDAAAYMTDLLTPWLPVLALLTIATGTAGMLAARRFAAIAANLVLISSGTLLVAVAAGSAEATAAALYYLPHTTLVTGGLLLLGGAIAEQRGTVRDTLLGGPQPASFTVTALAFATLAVSVAGAPPLAGFLGKVMLMQSMSQDAFGPAYWALLVLSGFVSALVLARAASIYFWERDPQPDKIVTHRLRRGEMLALLFFTAVGPLQVIGSGPLADYARAAAEQLHARQPYISAVLGNSTEILRARRP